MKFCPPLQIFRLRYIICRITEIGNTAILLCIDIYTQSYRKLINTKLIKGSLFYKMVYCLPRLIHIVP